MSYASTEDSEKPRRSTILTQPRGGISDEQLFDTYEPWEKWTWVFAQLRARGQTWQAGRIRDLGKMPGEEIPRSSGSQLGSQLLGWEIKRARIYRSWFIGIRSRMSFKRERKSRWPCSGSCRCLRECLGADLDYPTGLLLLYSRTITSKEEWQKSMAIRSSLDEGILRKDQIPAGVQVVLSKHCLFPSSLHLRYEFCVAFWAMQGTLFFIYMRRVTRWPWWQVSSHDLETTRRAAVLGPPPAVSFSTVYRRGSKYTSCSVLAAAGLPSAVAHQANCILGKNTTDASAGRPGSQLSCAGGKE